jgi:23S rRNA (cytidine1920-2'-O)/16S rRNA (cytidine1409-2'-O)-methyltransferase
MLRLDQSLVERGLCESREKAKRAIMAGQVKINDNIAHKPSDSVQPNDAVTLLAAEKFVSRGGYKLEHALQHFALDVSGCTAIDIGASTGGFTDCLLQHGAAKVYAVDVGQGQLAWKLRRDKRVVVMEKTNARELTPEKFFGKIVPQSSPSPRSAARGEGRGEGHLDKTASSPRPSPPKEERESAAVEVKYASIKSPVDLITIDCSFISLRKIIPPAVALLRPPGKIVALIKPQFEAGKAEADKGAGVITDAAVHERVLRELEEFVSKQTGLRWRGVTESPLLGPAGNKEFLALIEKTG